MARTAWILFSYVGCFPSYRPVVNTPVFGSRRPLSHCSLTLTTSVGQPHREAKAPEMRASDAMIAALPAALEEAGAEGVAQLVGSLQVESA